MAFTLLEIHEILGLPIPQHEKGDLRLISHLCIDSRLISFPAESLFIALQTERRDGHLFIPAAYGQGVRIFLVNKNIDIASFSMHDAIWLQVSDTLEAFQKIVATWRKHFSIPVIGITGSNGKTIIKEWLCQLVSPDYSICRSPRSYNSQIGVPLSVWQLKAEHQLGIFEAGISTTGEMEKLGEIIKPTIGIFSTLGAAHDEGFTSRQEKLSEKWKLFLHCDYIVCHTDDEAVWEQSKLSGKQLLSWGFRDDCNYIIKSLEQKGLQTDVALLHKHTGYDFVIPFTDAASIENSLHCIITCLHLGMNAGKLQERLSFLQPLQMRLEWKKGIYQSLLLNDSYSHDMYALEIALNHLSQQAGNYRKMAILSDMPGHNDEGTYQQIANLLLQKNVRKIVGVGLCMLQYENVFHAAGIGIECFADTSKLLEKWNRQSIEKSTVLIKGGRVFAFEKIVAALQQQQHETLLEIHLSALAHNLNVYRAQLKPGTKLMVMLKAFGYGSSDAELGRWLQHHGVDYLTVAYADEGVSLRQGGVHCPIMVMNPDSSSFESLIANKLEPELYSIEILQAFQAFATDNGLTQYPVHLKLDTGMHRLGFLAEQVDTIVDILHSNLSVKVVSVFTHLVAAENANHDDFTREQAIRFDAFCAQLANALPYTFLRHAANTAAIIRHLHLHYDMVRLGIGLFGVNNAAQEKLVLLPATHLYTTIAQIKDVAAGQTVGYGRNAILQRDSRIATVRIGYADGYRRQLGNGVGSMWVRGSRVAVVGNVCMDMTMLDVTDVPDAVAGDRVEVFGMHTTVSDIAKQCGTIPYEIMTGISQRVKRVMVEE
jgi:Alr-MurF fusion protein